MSNAAPERFELLVRSMRVEAAEVLTLRLELPSGDVLPPWAPGAHIDVRFANDVERQYSLCGDPADRSGWEISVLREGVSRGGSRYIHDTLRPGDLVSVSAPSNNFELTAANDTMFIAGGIGITALLPMIRAVNSSGASWRLAYLGRNRAGMAYLADPLFSAPHATVRSSDEGDRMSLSEWIGYVADGTQIYSCGPERMLDELEELSAGWPRGTLRVERFQARNFAELGDGEDFDVVAQRSGMRVSVGAGCSILETLEQAGIGVPSSCLEGVCGTCETTIVDGEAEHRDSILSVDERETNETMMICVSRSRTPELVLDI